VKRENAVEAYRICIGILKTTDKLKGILKTHKDVAASEL
jgi:hypothetical protein